MSKQGLVTPGESPASRPSTGLWALSAFFIVSWAVLGIAGTSNYFASEDHIGQTMQRLNAEGAALDVDGCVDAVLAWHPQCTALSGLCDASVERVMESCVAGRDRADECRSFGAALGQTSFGVSQCRDRGIERRKGQDKQCAKSYGSFASHCKALVPHLLDAEPPRVAP